MMVPLRPERGLAVLAEMLEHGCDGDPRWVVFDAANRSQANAIARRVAEQAVACGFVPIPVASYLHASAAAAEEWRERALVLIGAFDGSLSESRAAIVDAAARSRRPHLLLTFRSEDARRGVLHVHEARTAYGVSVRRGPPVPHPPEIVQHIERANRAGEFARCGRHAAAGRLLREIAATLARRNARGAAARTLIMLGRLLLERGRPDAADQVFGESAAVAGEDESLVLAARVWQALARTDAGRLTEAESICRAVILAIGPARVTETFARAALARVLLWQRRPAEAAEMLGTLQGGEDQPDAVIRTSIEATAVRVLLAIGQIFEAGQRTRHLLQTIEQIDDPIAVVVAQTAHLRVLAESGDLSVIESAFRRSLEAARAAHAPVRAARARLVWLAALRRAGREADARREARMLRRVMPSVPMLVRNAIAQMDAPVDRGLPATVAGRGTPSGAPSLVSLVQLAHEIDSDEEAVRRIAAWLATHFATSRVDLVSVDAGPVSTVVSAGCGLATHLGPRILESGIDLSEVHDGGREIGVPVRLGNRLLCAIVCRWPLDREPAPHAAETLAMAAAVAAPRVDAWFAAAREQARASAAVPDLVGVSGAMTDVRRAIERAATAPFAVLIEGESGAGKELVARAVHQLSPRRERRFCDVNCAAIPEDLLESELFGHARGAFTGAVVERPGLFEDAHEGTIFLDELPDLSPRGQAKLLRVLQQQEVRRVGETFSRKIDVRLVTATNRDMHAEVTEGRFRQDLLYRLEVIRIRLPPLRERPEDVAVLAEHFWKDAAKRVGTTARLTHGLLSELCRYHWPGNVRELQNVMAALAVAAPARGRVQPTLLPAAITGAAAITSRRLADARAQFERRYIEVALARAGGNRTRAARELGLSRQGLLKTMGRLGLAAVPCIESGEREE